MHGAKLASALLRQAGSLKGPAAELKLEGIGGRLMGEAGVRLLADIRELGVVGVLEVLGHWRAIWRVFQGVRQRLIEDPPDLLILIDYPDFNLRVAKVAKRLGVPVIYYISPQVWAWRSGRVRQIAQRVEKMLVIFPFEKSFYDAVGVDCVFVGHPLMDDLQTLPSKEELRAQLGLEQGRRTVGLFPGSRRQEVCRMLPAMMTAMKRLKKRVPGLQLLLSVASSLDMAWVRSLAASQGLPELRFIYGEPERVIAASDALVASSGTVTLQAAVREVPLVIVYKVSFLTYLLGRLLIRTDHVGMANIVAEEEVAPELLQGRMTPEAIEGEVHRILTEPSRCDRLKKGLAQVKIRLGPPGASSRAAQVILDYMAEKAAG